MPTLPDDALVEDLTAQTNVTSVSKRLKDGYKIRDAHIRGGPNDLFGKLLKYLEQASGVDAQFFIPPLMACICFILSPGAGFANKRTPWRAQLSMTPRVCLVHSCRALSGEPAVRLRRSSHPVPCGPRRFRQRKDQSHEHRAQSPALDVYPHHEARGGSRSFRLLRWSHPRLPAEHLV